MRLWDMSDEEIAGLVKSTGASLYGNFRRDGKKKIVKALPGEHGIDYNLSVSKNQFGARVLNITLYNPDLPDSFWERGYSYVDDHAVRRVAICV